MGADKARRSFDAGRMYRSVVSQQGRVTLEADVNEAEEIRAAESRAELREIVGPTGSPDAGFQITMLPPPVGKYPFDFAIAAGSIYVGGMRVSQREPTTYERQKMAERDKVAEWCDFPTGSAAADPNATATPPFDELVYLFLTEQEVSAVEDGVLREVALGGPDTSARTRLVQRVMRAPKTTDDCEESLAQTLGATTGVEFDASTMRVTTTGRLKADTITTGAPPEPCEPTAQGGFLGAENQLIRVQVTGGGGDQPLLWGYDNASFLYRGKVSPDQRSIQLVGKPVDVFHRPRPGQCVEVLNVAVDLGGGERIAASYGLPYSLDGYDATSNTIHLPVAVVQRLNADVFVRVWENRLTFSGDSTTATELVTADGTGTGVVVRTTGSPVAGDYWTIGVRPSTPTDILPARLRTEFQPPDGPNRWATALATIHWLAKGVGQVHDCRRPFDDLVDLTRAKGCALALRPGDDLQRLIDRQIIANTELGIRGLHVSFADGRFYLDAPLEFRAIKRGHLTISGCGRATEIVAVGLDSAIVTSGWDTTTVSDLSIATEQTPEGQPRAQIPQIGGALTILDTGAALVERVAARCASSTTRTASCVTIRNTESGTGTAACVRSCDLAAGVNQIGALLVNTAFATVEDNQISVHIDADLPIVTTRRTLIGNVRMGDHWSTEPTNSFERANISFPLWGSQVLAFTTETAFADLWLAVLTAHRSELVLEGRDGNVTTDDRRRIRDFIDGALTQILHPGARGPLLGDEPGLFRRRVRERQKAPSKVAPAAGQGIVVAGAVATDLRILHNTIRGTMRAIHVGLSQQALRDAESHKVLRGDHLRAERVQIIGNTIWHRVPADRPSSQAGIFVGNVDLATIRDNRIRCEFDPTDDGPQATRRAEGIRVWGVLGGPDGHFLSISGNISQASSTGIRVVQLGQSGQDSLVQIIQNLAMATQTPIEVVGAYEVAINNRP